MHTDHAPLKPGFIFIGAPASLIGPGYFVLRRGDSGYFAKLTDPSEDSATGFEPVLITEYDQA